MSVAQKGRSSSEDVDHRGQQLHGPPSRRSPASAARASSGLTEQRLVLHRPATYLQRPVARQISRRISSTIRSSGAVAITPPLPPPQGGRQFQDHAAHRPPDVNTEIEPPFPRPHRPPHLPDPAEANLPYHT